MALPIVDVDGNLVADPELRFTPNGVPVAEFRVACGESKKDPETGKWKDGDTTFLTCVAWQKMAENVAESLQRGMPVVGKGRLKQRSYETRDGEKRTVYEVHLFWIGPNLSRVSAKINRAQRNPPAAGSGTGGFGGNMPDSDLWGARDGGGGFSDDPPF